MSNAIIEAAARALQDSLGSTLLPKTYQALAEIAVAAVTPLIRAAALEEAAHIADDHHKAPYAGPEGDAYWIAAKIRALKEQP
jgi:hypothetical protein